MYGYRSNTGVSSGPGSWWLMVALVAAAGSQAAAAYFAFVTYNGINNLFSGSGSQSFLLVAVRAEALAADANRAQFWMNAANASCAAAAIFLLVWSSTNRHSWGHGSSRVFTLFALVCTVGAVGARLYARQAAKDSAEGLIAQFSNSPGAALNAAFDLVVRLGRIEAYGLVSGAAAAAFLFAFITSTER